MNNRARSLALYRGCLPGWTGLARLVRGKLLELRGGDFVVAARVSGATGGAVIRGHLLPSLLGSMRQPFTSGGSGCHRSMRPDSDATSTNSSTLRHERGS